MIKNLFGAKKKTELEKNQEELQIVNGAIQEETQKIQRLNEGLKLVQIELEVDSSDKDTQKRTKRLEDALKGSQERLNEAQARKVELESKIQELKDLERQQTINELAKADVERLMTQRRSRMYLNAIYSINLEADSRAGNAGALTPWNLARHLGENELDSRNPAHAQHLEAFKKLAEEETKKAQDELDKLIADIKKYLGME